MTKRRKSSSSQIQINGASIADLPWDIGAEIFLKLPVKSIIMCKSVCKTWRCLISDQDFVKLHLTRSKACTLIRNMHQLRFSRSLYLLEHEDVCSPESGYCLCRSNSADKCKHFRFNTRLTSKLKIPICNAEYMLDKANEDTNVMFRVKSKSRSSHFITVESSFGHKYALSGSCNGLLCLYMMYTDYSVVVCNPVTGEFIRLPECEGYDQGCFQFALGFSPRHNQYKVIRYSITKDRAVAIHTLGTDSWRNLDISAYEFARMGSPAYLGGSLHWILNEEHIATLDMDEEQLRVDSVPPPPPYDRYMSNMSLVVLEGRMYLYTKYSSTHEHIWVMDHNNGASKTWTKLFSIDHSGFRRFRYQLICCVNNEAVVMFDDCTGEFMYFDQSEGLRFKQLKFQNAVAEPLFAANSYIPSFISLKDVVMQGNVEVLNINSGCGKLKLWEEFYPPYLRGSRK